MPNKYEQDGLRIDLREVSLADKPTYITLQYTWGPMSQKSAIECIDERFIEVTQNLYDALNELQSTEPLQLWI